MSAAAFASPMSNGAQRCRSTVEGSPAEAAPRHDLGQALELSPADLTFGESCSSGETSPIGLSLLYQKRCRQMTGGLVAVDTSEGASLENLENQGIETSPIGKSLLDRKRYHARIRMQKEKAGLSDGTGAHLNAGPTCI